MTGFEKANIKPVAGFLPESLFLSVNFYAVQYELSYWEYDSFFCNLDVAVLGSGIVGLSTAVRLKELAPALNVAVIDRGALPIGASTRNAGFACFGSMTELLDDLETQPEDAVWALVERRWKGLLRLRERLGDAALQYEALGGYELFRSSEKETYQRCLDHLPAFNRAVAGITGSPETYRRVAPEEAAPFGFRDAPHLLLNTLEGQLHTGQMMRAWMQLAQEKGVLWLGGLSITRIHADAGSAVLETAAGWSFSVPQLVVAVNGFARALLPDLEVTPARNQVLVTQPIPGLTVQGAFHYDRGYYYFRNVGHDRLLLGGGRHLAAEAEMTDRFGTTPLIQEALLQLLNDMILPDTKVEIAHWWSGILGIGSRKSPIVQRVNPHTVVAVRMGGMGVAIGTLVGEEAAALVVGMR
jgi:gamma-glutamylputrescine oxidase